MSKRLANLARNKQRAKRRGNPRFYGISSEHKALKKEIAAIIDSFKGNKNAAH